MGPDLGCPLTVTSQVLPGFDLVRRLTRTLDGVEESTAYGASCLKVRDRMFACIAINKSAEPNSLMVRVSSFAQRDDLLAEQPDLYYVTPHYEPYPCVLVRLGKVPQDALRDLLLAAWKDASAKRSRPAKSAKRKRTAR